MQDLTLVIPAKYESESLPIFLNEIKEFSCQKIVVLDESDKETINSIKHFENIEILYQKKKRLWSCFDGRHKPCIHNFFLYN